LSIVWNSYILTRSFLAHITRGYVIGFLGGLYQLFVVSGILYSYVLGNFLNYNQLNLACGVWMAVHILGVLYIPESPYFLIQENKRVGAEEAMARLRDPSHDCKSELDEIQVRPVIVLQCIILLYNRSARVRFTCVYPTEYITVRLTNICVRQILF